ncbi:MFS domain-containing protein [Fusarium keratoplasticum]|nr:MFS domain-containing protein [Fusarium keratoplasticum]
MNFLQRYTFYIWLEHFNRHLALAFSAIAVSTFNYGFDNTAYNNTQAMDAFQRQFGDWSEAAGTYKISPSWLSLFNSLNYIGFGAGVTIMAVTSVSKHQIMATRILNYIYIGMELAVVPVYQSEIMPKEIRGFAVGSY